MECLHWHIRQFQTLKRDKKAPEEVVVSDDPSDEEGEERHEEELGDKANDRTDGLLEHLGNNVFVVLVFDAFVIFVFAFVHLSEVLNTLTMMPMSSWAPMLIELSSTMTTMTRVQNLFQNGLFMMMKTGVVILVSFLVSTHRERLLNPITSPLTQRGFVLPGPARSLDWDSLFIVPELGQTWQ